MDDSFRVRVEKVFGSLASASISSTLGRSPWSVSDEEIERREWRRETDTSGRDEMPCSSSFDEFLKEDRKKHARVFKRVLDDDDDDDRCNQAYGGGEDGIDDWEIRSSIGLDRTLDNEEEEDEFDKVASGSDNPDGRLYMSAVNDHGPYLNSNNVLPNTLHGTTKDSRANSLAAKRRLKEDEDEAEGKTNKFNHHQAYDAEVKEPHVKVYEDGVQPRSILKRKETDDAFSKLQKRVRFEPGCENDCQEASEECQVLSTGSSLMNTKVSDKESVPSRNTSGVPDYIRNPSNYTHYSFDSLTEVDEDSNTEACIEFLESLKRSRAPESESALEHPSADVPKAVTFIPKKKASDTVTKNISIEIRQNKENYIHRTGSHIGIAASETQQSDSSTIEEDYAETNLADGSVSCQKSGRRYRTMSMLDD